MSDNRALGSRVRIRLPTMKIAVCVKQVPEATGQRRIDPSSKVAAGLAAELGGRMSGLFALR